MPPIAAFAVALVVTITGAEELFTLLLEVKMFSWTEVFVLCVTFALTNTIKEVWRVFLFFNE